jgi:hypothetical protein
MADYDGHTYEYAKQTVVEDTEGEWRIRGGFQFVTYPRYYTSLQAYKNRLANDVHAHSPLEQAREEIPTD